MDVTADNEALGNAQGSAPYYRAAAARTRRLHAEATTPRIKQRLGKMVTWYEQLAEQVEGLSVVEGLDQIFPQATRKLSQGTGLLDEAIDRTTFRSVRIFSR
jgi:hypothetical protein